MGFQRVLDVLKGRTWSPDKRPIVGGTPFPMGSGLPDKDRLERIEGAIASMAEAIIAISDEIKRIDVDIDNLGSEIDRLDNR